MQHKRGDLDKSGQRGPATKFSDFYKPYAELAQISISLVPSITAVPSGTKKKKNKTKLAEICPSLPPEFWD